MSNNIEDNGDILSLSDVSPEQFAKSNFAVDSRWRSLAVESGPSILNKFEPIEKMSGNYSHGVGPPKLAKNESSKHWVPLNINLLVNEVKDEEIIVTEAPYLLMKTNFECGKFSLDSIVDAIDQILHETIEGSYEFVPSQCTWKAICRQGSAKCKFEVSVYKGFDKSSYIIEAHKLTSGDGILFTSIYDEIKNNLTGTASSPEVGEIVRVHHPSCAHTVASEAEIQASITEILHLGNEVNFEAKEEASHMLYDVSTHDSLLLHLGDPAVLEFFISVLTEDHELFDNAKHNVILAMANISDSLAGQAAIIESGALPSIFNLAANGSYVTVEMRRECARIIANVTTKFAVKVAASVSPDDLQSWLVSVDHLEDDKLKMHAERAKHAFTTSCAV